MESNNTESPSWTGSQSRRDFLTKIEAEIQEHWDSKNIFDVDATETNGDTKQKFYVTLPPVLASRQAIVELPLYRAEFAAGYQRLRGKHVLFALGIAKAGIQNLYKLLDRWRKSKLENANDMGTEVVAKDFRKKNHANASPVLPYKLKEIGLEEDELLTLTEEQLIEVIVNDYKKQLRALGFKIDLRRSFLSWSSVYGSFLKWQFAKLKLQNRLVSVTSYGRYVRSGDYFLTSDQDLAEGEGENARRFVVVKQLLLEPYPNIISEYEGQRPIYFLTSCARPGLAVLDQTNIWAMPYEDYGVFELKDNLLVICNVDTANNLAYQGFSMEHGVVNCLRKFSGANLIGAKASAPFSPHSEVYVWPAQKNRRWRNVRTGLGISCPSIDVMDCYLWKRMQESEDIRAEYNMDAAQILPFDFRNLIRTQKGLLRDMHIRDLKGDANDNYTYFDEFGFNWAPLVDIEGFQANNITEFFTERENRLLESGAGLMYYSTRVDVITRTGEKIVIARRNTNAINYGAEDWINRVEARLHTMEMDERGRNILEVDALHRLTNNFWNFTRDWNFDIFSDYKADAVNYVSSTTMSSTFLAISHLIERYHIEPKDLTFDVFEYIIGNNKTLEGCPINIEVLDLMRQEFKFWVPADVTLFTNTILRTIGLFTLFDNMELLGEEKCPKSYYLAPETFSWNFRFRGEILHYYSFLQTCPADAIRLVFASVLDSVDDMVYYDKENELNASVLQLTKEFKWIHQIYNSDVLSDNTAEEFPERLFAAQISQATVATTEAFDNNKFKDAVKEGFYQLMNYRDNYRSFCESAGRSMNKLLIHHYIRTLNILLSPICPHITEHTWLNVLKEKDSILNAQWPAPDAVHPQLLQINEYLTTVVSNAHTRKNMFMKKKAIKCPGILERAFIAVTNQYQGVCADALQVYYDYITEYPHEYPLHERKISQLMSTDPHTAQQKAKAIQFLNHAKGRITWIPGSAALIIDSVYDFNEANILEENKKYLASKLGVKEVIIIEYSPALSSEGVAQPYSPSIIFNNSQDEN